MVSNEPANEGFQRDRSDVLRDETDKLLVDFYQRFNMIDPEKTEYPSEDAFSLVRAAFWQGVKAHIEDKTGELGRLTKTFDDAGRTEEQHQQTQ